MKARATKVATIWPMALKPMTAGFSQAHPGTERQFSRCFNRQPLYNDLCHPIKSPPASA